MKALGCITFIGLTALFCGQGYAHVDNHFLLEGCGSCHVGHGISNEPMLAASQEQFCYQCHGSEEKASLMISEGKLSAAAIPEDIEREFDKMYRHPVEEGTGHTPNEVLPQPNGARVDHAECVDCHNPHQKITKIAGQPIEVTGYSLTGRYLQSSQHEYEICLKCHTGNSGLLSDEKDMRQVFSVSTASQHPVTKPASIDKPASLFKSATPGVQMRCSDCHTNDNPDGPRGPHGSNYEFLLSGNYDTDIYADESPFAYQFCYSCHDRSSILDNESFPLHREHIVGQPLKGIKGTSCFTCHASHSSKSNLHLIEFNTEAVQRNQNSGAVSYSSTAIGSGECYLTCHGYSHNPGRY